MPSVTTTVEDTSPLISYSANWQAGTAGSDTQADSYSQSSFTLTQTNGASMTFDFYGTSAVVFGARRGNHGNYGGQLDKNLPSSFNGQSSNDLFNQNLFIANSSLGHHQLTITNTGSTFFDVDYITFESNVGQDGEDLIVNMFKDTHPAFTYTPSSSWTTPTKVGTFSGGSGHATSDQSAIAALTFELISIDPGLIGDAVALYGPVGPSSSTAYSIQVDNGNTSVFSANKQFYRPQQIIYFAANLGPGEHSLKVQNLASKELAIDYATVYTTKSFGGSFIVTTPVVTTRRIPSGVIAALALTTTLAILASLFAVFLVWRWRHKSTSIFGLRYKHKPVAGVQGPEFSQSFLMYPSYVQRSPSNRSNRSTTDPHSPSQNSWQAPTSLTVPTTMTTEVGTVDTQSAVASNSGYYTTSPTHPDVPVSVSQFSESAAHTAQATGATRSEKSKNNPTGSSILLTYDPPTAIGPHYVGLQLPAQHSASPTNASPPEYSQNPRMDDQTLHVSNQ